MERVQGILIWLVIGAVGSVKAADPLPSWNDMGTKKAIIDFVTAVTTRGSPNFVPPQDCIATFDNDGTLRNENPFEIHFAAVFDHIKRQMTADPSLKARAI